MVNNINTTIGVGMSSTNKHIGTRKCSDATKHELEKSEDILSIELFYILPIIASIGLIAHYVVARVFIRLGLDVRYNVIMLVYAVGRSCFMLALIGYALPLTFICPYLDDEYSFPFIYFRLIYVFDVFGNLVWVTMPHFILIERLLAVGVLPLRVVELISVKKAKLFMVCYVVVLLVYSVVFTLGSKHGYNLDAAYENSYTKCGGETVFEYDCITKGEHCIFEIVWNRHLIFAIHPALLTIVAAMYDLIPVYINIFGCLVLVILLYRKSKKNKRLSGKKRLDIWAHIVVIVSCVDFCVFQIIGNPILAYFKYFQIDKASPLCGMDKFNYDIRLSEFVNSTVLVSCYLQCIYPIVFSSKFRKVLLDFLPAGVRDSVICKKCHQYKMRTFRQASNNKNTQLESTGGTQRETTMTGDITIMDLTEEFTKKPYFVVEEKSGHGGEVVKTTEGFEQELNPRSRISPRLNTYQSNSRSSCTPGRSRSRSD